MLLQSITQYTIMPHKEEMRLKQTALRWVLCAAEVWWPALVHINARDYCISMHIFLLEYKKNREKIPEMRTSLLRSVMLCDGTALEPACLSQHASHRGGQPVWGCRLTDMPCTGPNPSRCILSQLRYLVMDACTNIDRQNRKVSPCIPYGLNSISGISYEATVW